MTPEATIDIFRQGIYVAILLLTIIVIPGLLLGLLIAMFQAATSINEMSLSFVPKLILTLLVLSVASPWMLKILVNYTQSLITDIPLLIG